MTDAAEADAAPAPPRKTTGRAGLVLLLGMGLVVGLHIAMDRHTPFTSQARVNANVVPLAAEVAGPVQAVHVRDNQLVLRGQPLFTISDQNYALALENAQANLVATRRELASQDQAIVAAEANRAIALTEMERARIDAARFQRVYEEDNGAISVRRLETAQASYKQAQARVQAADAQVAQARVARGSTGADNDRLLSAQSAVAKAQLDVGRTTVRAPGAGLVTDLQLDRGQFAAAGSPVLSFIAIHDAWVTADLTENNLGNVTPGQPVEILLDVMPGRILKGKVLSVSRGVSSGGPSRPGSLATVSNDRDFLRQAQRFPVRVGFTGLTADEIVRLRQGGQASVIVYTGDNPLLNALGRLWIRAAGILSYAY